LVAQPIALTFTGGLALLRTHHVSRNESRDTFLSLLRACCNSSDKHADELQRRYLLITLGSTTSSEQLDDQEISSRDAGYFSSAHDRFAAWLFRVLAISLISKPAA
jgi:hypothetical protein